MPYQGLRRLSYLLRAGKPDSIVEQESDPGWQSFALYDSIKLHYRLAAIPWEWDHGVY